MLTRSLYIRLVRLPGVAPGWWPSAKTFVAGSHSSVKSQPRKLKGPGAPLHSQPMPFQQRTNTSWRSIRSQPAVSRRLFRCLGAHLLRSPSIVKSSADTRACFLAANRQNPLAENLGSPTPQPVLCLLASSRCRLNQSATEKATADHASRRLSGASRSVLPPKLDRS